MTAIRLCHAMLLPVLATLPMASAAQHSAFDDLSTPDGLPPLLTPTHLRQAPRDVPASVTVISGDQLLTYGILAVVEAVRLVAGGGPSRLGWANEVLLLGDKKSSSPQRVAILIDGTQVQGPEPNENEDWTALPISVDEVDRVEVSRGPGVAGYRHATTTVMVNIVTKHAADVERGFARAIVGSQGTVHSTARVGLSLGPAALRVTAHQRQRDWYDEGQYRSPLRLDRVMLRGVMPLRDASTLALDAAHMTARMESDPGATPPAGAKLARNGYANLTWTQSFSAANELRLNLNHWYRSQRDEALSCDESDSAGSVQGGAQGLRQTMPSARAWAAQRAAPVCLSGVREERRSIVEVQDIHMALPGLRLVGGVGLRREWRQVADSAVDARWQADYRRLFAGVDWQAGTDYSASAGISADDAGSRGHDHALRAGFNWHLSPDQTLRIAWSASRWASDAGRLLDPESRPVLREHAQAVDLGYLALWPAVAGTLEARLYWARLSGRAWSTKGKTGQELPAHTEVTGVELRGASNLGDCCTGFAGLSAMTEAANSGTDEPSGEWPWTMGLGAAWTIGGGWQLAAAHYRTSENNSALPNSARTDVTLLKDIVLTDARVRATLIWRQIERIQRSDNVNLPDAGSHRFYASIQAAF